MKRLSILLLVFISIATFAQKKQSDTIPNSSAEAYTVLSDEVVITASRLKAGSPLTFTDIDKQQITQNNITSNLPFMLELLPSVVATSENGIGIGNTSLRIRGADASRINVNINGLSYNDPESQSVFWCNIPNLAGMSQSIQVQRGASSSTGGNTTFGGGINLQTELPSQSPYAKADFTYGSFNTITTSLSVGTGLMKYGFSIDGVYTKWLTDGYIRNGKVDNQSLFLNVSRSGQKSILRLVAMLGRDRSGITWEGNPDPKLYGRQYNPAGQYTDEMGNVLYYDNETNNYWQNNFQLFYSQILNHQFTLNLAANYVNGYGYYENYKEDQKFGSKFGLPNQVIDGVTYKASDIIRRKEMRNDFYVGTASVNYNNDFMNIDFGGKYSYYLGDHFGRLIWAKYNENIPANYEWYRNEGVKSDVNIFAKGDFNLGKGVNLFADLQYRNIFYDMKGIDDDLADLSQEHSYSFFNPQIGVSYSFAPKHNLYLSAGIVSREPTRADIKDASKYGKTTEIKAENMLDIELGYGFKTNRGALNANLYFMGYRNQLVPTGKISDVGYVLMDNVPQSYRLGIELSGGMRILKWLKFDANLTLSKNNILDYTYYVDQFDANWEFIGQRAQVMGSTTIAFSPSTVGAAIITFEPIKKLNLQLIGKYVGAQYFDNTSLKDSRLDGYFITNIKAGYTWEIKKTSSIELQFIVNNVFNIDYINNAWIYRSDLDGKPEISYGYFPQAGINYNIRMIIKI